MNSVDLINRQVTEYQQLAVLLIVVAIVFAIATVALWFVLDIYHAIRVITGVGMDKELRKIRESSKSGTGTAQVNPGTVVTWNTSGLLRRDKSKKLDHQTRVLEENEFLEEATTILEEISEDFVIEEDIKITGTDQNI